MGRSPCCSKEGLNRGAWTAMEDKILTDYIKVHGEGKWRNLPIKAGLKRCGKSCRLRWLNYLKPDIKRGNITRDEEDLIIRLHKLLGNRWSLIAGRLPGRTDNEIKNYWNTNIGKKVQASNPNPATPSRRKQDDHRELYTHHPNAAPVVRTKAKRCSKRFMPQEPEHQNDTKMMTFDSELVGQGCSGGPSSWVPDEPDSSRFLLDDDDGRFLQEILEANFSSQQSNVDSRIDDGDEHCKDGFAEISGAGVFFSEETKEGFDTNWLESFLYS